MGIDSSIAVAAVINELGNVDGRKRLQKIIHLLKTKGHNEFKQSFILHYFGPFSRQLASELDFLVSAKLVEESGDSDGYTYSVSDESGDRIDDLCLSAEVVFNWREFVQLLNEKDTSLLESISTLVFINNCKNSCRGNKLRTEFSRIKPHLKPRYEDALKFAKNNSLLHTTH